MYDAIQYKSDTTGIADSDKDAEADSEFRY